MNSYWLSNCHPIKRHKIDNSHYQPITRDFFGDSIVKDLPLQLIYEILLRSPAESLGRFKSVCKDWYSLIKDPNFVKQHYDHQKANNQSIGIVFMYDSDYIQKYYLTILNRLWEYEDVPCNNLVTKTDKITVEVPTDRISKLTSCRGLLCFHTEFPLLMLNSITKEVLTLPKPWIEEEKEEASACGFGFDAKNNAYKVVQLKRCLPNSALECEVLELGNTMSWRRIQHQPSFPHPHIGDPEMRPEPVFVEGSIYWHASQDQTILCFDVAAETFKLIPEPDEYQKADGIYSTLLVELDNSLCLVAHDISSGVVRMWKMQKDCVEKRSIWIKSCNFDTKCVNNLEDIDIKPLCTRSKKIYLKHREGLACYDTERQILTAPIFSRVADDNIGAVAYTKTIACLRDIVAPSTLAA